MTPVTMIALGLTPAIALVLYLYLMIRNDRKFGLLLIRAFFGGIIGSAVVSLSVYLAGLTGINVFTDLSNTLFYSFVIIGFGSELGKFIILKLFILPKPEADTPVHGMVFSVFTALGFSTVVVILFYLNLLNANPPYPVNMFMLLSGPANICFGVIMGFFIGMSKFVESKFIYNISGLIAASFFNGLLSFCLISHDYKLLSLFAFGSAIVVMVLIVRSITFRP